MRTGGNYSLFIIISRHSKCSYTQEILSNRPTFPNSSSNVVLIMLIKFHVTNSYFPLVHRDKKASVSCQISTSTFPWFVTPARNDVWSWLLHWKKGLQLGYNCMECREVAPRNRGAMRSNEVCLKNYLSPLRTYYRPLIVANSIANTPNIATSNFLGLYMYLLHR